MRKIYLLASFVFFSALSVTAQSPLGKGGAQVNAGLGFSSWGTPIYAGVDFGVHPDITIGPRISFRNNSDWNQNLIVLGFNGNYHFNNLLDLPSEWNVYAGASIGYYIWSDSDILGARNSGIGFDGQIGARYFFTEKFGINLEFGGGMATGGGLGITYKFR